MYRFDPIRPSDTKPANHSFYPKATAQALSCILSAPVADRSRLWHNLYVHFYFGVNPDLGEKKTPYDASASMAGYLYQSRLALLSAMRRARTAPGDYVAIETFDDVSFHDQDDVPKALIQAKHHVTQGDLSDHSPDVWRTLRIWANKTHSDPKFPTTCQLFLITTARADLDSAMRRLRFGTSHDERAEALHRLNGVAAGSENKSTELARKEFASLPSASKTGLINNIHVIDATPNISEIQHEIAQELVFTTTDHKEVVAEQLEGWWLDRVGNALIQDGPTYIALQDIVRKVVEIGGTLQRNELPITIPVDSGKPDYKESDESYTFVAQMRILEVKDGVVKRGVNDFYKAKAQRARWAREDLLLDGETDYYDSKLIDRWERQFDKLQGSGILDNDANKLLFGRNLLFWAQEQSIPFRNVVETWITAGSYHNLSNNVRVGWHPDFSELFSDTSRSGE